MHLDGVREVVVQEAHRAVGQPVVVEREDLSSVSWDELSTQVKGRSVTKRVTHQSGSNMPPASYWLRMHNRLPISLGVR
jgi:hypothetical protein